MKNRPWVISSLLLIFSALLPPQPGTVLGENRENAALPPATVTTAPVTHTPIVNQIELIGTVIARHRAEIASKVSGTIAEMHVQLGSRINAGELLIKISAGEIDARARQAKAQLQQAQRNLDRERKLLQRDAATPETVKSFTEALAIAEAGFEEAETMQGYTRIAAPFSGIVTAKPASQGDLATPGKILLEMEDLSQLQILTDIPEAQVQSLAIGDELPVRLPAANLILHGTVVEISPTVNPTTRSAAIKLDIPDHPGIRPGQFSRVQVPGDRQEALTIPSESIVERGQLKIVFIVDANHRAHLRLIETGMVYQERVEILSGLEPGERVTISGHQRLLDGQSVKLQ